MANLDPIVSLWSNSWRRCTARFWTLVEICLLPAIVISAGDLLMSRASFFSIIMGSVVNVVGLFLIVVTSVTLISSVAGGTDFGASYERGMRLFWPALLLVILNGVACLGGFVLFIVPGVFLLVSLVFANYVLVMEDIHGIDALVASRAYVKGHWWAIFGRGVLLDLLISAAMLVIYAPATALLGSIVGGIVYVALLLIFVPFSVCYLYEIYENLRRLRAAAVPESVKHGKGEKAFLTVCMLVGAVAVVLFIVFAAFALNSGSYGAPPGGYYPPAYPTIPPPGTPATL